MQCRMYQPGCVINNVLIGESKHLFLFEGNHNQFSYLSKQKLVSESFEKNFLDNLRSRRKLAEKLKIQYIHVVIPCKPLVVRDKLPDPYNIKYQ